MTLVLNLKVDNLKTQINLLKASRKIQKFSLALIKVSTNFINTYKFHKSLLLMNLISKLISETENQMHMECNNQKMAVSTNH